MFRSVFIGDSRLANCLLLKSMKRKIPSMATSSLSSESGRVAVIRPQEYEAQLQKKIDTVREIFSDVKIPDLEVFRSPASNYRQRCEFRVYHEGEDLYYVMFEKDSSPSLADKPQMIRKDSFPAASTLINELMPLLLELVKKEPILKRKLYTVAFHTTLTQQAMITMVYHKKLSEEWEQSAKQLALSLSSEVDETTKINIIGRSRKQKILIGNDFVHETFTINGQQYTYKQMEGCFSQPNGMVCASMLSWAQKVTKNDDDDDSSPMTDLLELYCGNCNFTIPLAQNFKHIIATELSRVAVGSARENIDNNKINNIILARMSSEEFVKKWKSGELGNRLKNHKSSDFNLSTILVDPPRSGLDESTTQLLSEFDHVLYISCNPHSLRLNINNLLTTHQLTHFAVFDQFPYTGHIECGVHFVRY